MALWRQNIKRLWIIFASGAITFFYSLCAILSVFFWGISRQRTDRIVRAWSKALLNLVKVEHQVFNPHQVRFEQGKLYIVMCNHTSVYDIPLSIIGLDGSVRMLAKKELRSIPIFGLAMEKNEFVFIDRKNHHQAMLDLKQAADKMRSGIVLWVAPEGTRSLDGKLLPFKKGAFIMAIENRAVIVPLGIRGARDIVASKSLEVNTGKKVELHLGAPIDASEYSLGQRDELIEVVRQSITALRD